MVNPEKTCKGITWSLALVTLLLVAGPMAVHGQAGLPVVDAESADVTGFILYSDGETPAKNLPIRVWDIEQEKFVYNTESDDNGMYRIPTLEKGRYTIYYDRIRTHLNMLNTQATASAHSHNIVVILPRNIAALNYVQMQATILAGTLVSAVPLVENQLKDTPTTIISVTPPPPPPPKKPPVLPPPEITPPPPPPVVSP